VDNAGSSFYYIDQPSGTNAADLASTLSSGSTLPLQLGASFNSFGGLVMEFGMMNSSAFNDENNLRTYLTNKWGTGGCPPINSVENGHGVIATTSNDYWCRVPFNGRDCTQACAAGNGSPVGGVPKKTCQNDFWSASDLVCEKTCDMTEGPKFTKGCYRTVVSADFNAGQSAISSGPMTTFRLYPRQNNALTNVYMSVTSDGRLKMDPR